MTPTKPIVYSPPTRADPNGRRRTTRRKPNGLVLYRGPSLLNGQAIAYPDARGQRVVDASFYVLFNAHYEPLTFTLPTRDWGDHWVTVLDTSKPVPEESDRIAKAGEQVQVRDRSIVLLRCAD